MLFALWGGSVYRATRDLDFMGYGESGADDVRAALREICEFEVVDDGLVFVADSFAIAPIREEAEYSGLRVRFHAMLGKTRIDMQIDIGFGNKIEPPADEVSYPVLVDAPSPSIRAYPHEAVVAEKLHASVVLGERNTRLKDFYDLHTLAKQFAFDGTRLSRAIAATFERRKTTIDVALPVALTARFFESAERSTQWRAYLTRNKLPGAPADFAAVGQLQTGFIGPVWAAPAGRRAFDQTWAPSGPWAQKTSKERSE